MTPIVKTFFCLIILFWSCNLRSQTATPGKPFSKYYFLFTVRKGIVTKVDTLGTLAQADSIAYLEARIKFGRYWTDYTVAKYLNTPEPISFKVINEKGEDVKSRLDQKVLNAIETTAFTKIEDERNHIYDSSGQIRNYGSDNKGVRNTIDSLTKANSSQQ